MKTFLFTLAVFTVFEAVGAQNPRVTVNEGIIVGRTVRFSEDTFINKTRDVDVFLGVPYAEPPERFAPPLSKASWTGERNATEFSAACAQDPFGLGGLYPVTSEDCLYLNIYAPSQRQPGTPVMVWIHGGGFTSGSAMTYEYSGIPLVTVGDVIVVAINYRLGVFAQFSTEDDVAPGNYGMLDQVAALEWVYNNIEAFDGNKDDITIFGESAGAASVSFHLLSKLSRSFFNKAIMQSGTALSPWAFNHDPERERRLSRELGDTFGCDTSTSEVLVACLKLQDADELREKAFALYNIGVGYPVTLDGTFLEDTPANLYEMGDFAKVPLLAGVTKDEGTLIPFLLLPGYIGTPSPPVVDRATFDFFVNFFRSHGLSDDILGDSINQEYIDWTIADDPEADYFSSVVDLGTDFYFAAPTDYVIRKHANAGGTVYKYLMTHEPSQSILQYGDIVPYTPWLGAGHGEDLTFVFGMPFIDELYNIRAHNITAEEKALSVKFMEFWTNFAKSGDPSRPSEDVPRGDGEDFWPLYTIPELSHKELSLELGVGRAARARGCRFWNHYIPSLMIFTSSMTEEEREWRESYNDWKGEMVEWQRVFEDYKKGATCNN
ncbi:acetylcholinesterase-like [Diadema antillarum]|uniref:acetylcholinesterase-like n=1 Tax=Diadema antillarum TaxID=105358 RepID=UPI003A86C7AA